MKPGTILSRKIIRELQARGWWATQISAAMNTGIPDILATRPGGSIHIEVKAEGDTIRESQSNWAINYYRAVGGHVYVVVKRPTEYEVLRFDIDEGDTFCWWGAGLFGPLYEAVNRILELEGYEK